MVKAAYPPFTGFRIDVKYLTGIPFFWPQMQHNGWPRFQYTIRELSCGAQFLADSSRCYKSPADLLALKAPHLSPKIFFLYPIPLESLLHLTGGHDVPGRMKTFASDPDPKNC